MIIGYITGQSLKIQAPVVVSDSINYLTAQFFFQTEDWKDLTKWAHFKQGATVYDFALEKDRIEKDAHLNLSDGEWEVYLHGNEFSDGEVVERITTEIVTLTVKKGGVLDGEPFAEQPASEVERLNAKLDKFLETGIGGKVSSVNGKDGDVVLTAEDVGALSEDNLDEAIDKALLDAKESGEFKGDKGDKGDAGAPGYTPVKGVDYFDGANGKDGRDGQDGYTPIKGVDYFDGQDGKDGYTPVKGIDYFDGIDGKDGATGADGKTAYQYAQDGGYAGTEEEFAEKLAKSNPVKPSVKDYGAKGNGTTDDTDAFKDALDNNRLVYVPEGTYVLSDTITIGANSELELAQSAVLKFTQTATHCIAMKRIASIKGNHATIIVPYNFNAHVIHASTDVDNGSDVPPFTKWDPQWKNSRYVTDINICKPDSRGFHYSVNGDCYGTAVYLGCYRDSGKFMWGVNMSGVRIAGGFTYGIHIYNELGVNAEGKEDNAWNHDMRIEAVMDACETGVLVENCNNAHLAVTVQPRRAYTLNEVYIPYAKYGIKLVNSKNIDLSSSCVWDWDDTYTLWTANGEYQHLVMLGQCRGLILSDFLYYENSTDIRSLIYTDTPSNLEKMTILQEPFTRWFKPIDGRPYFSDGGDNKPLLLKEEFNECFETDYVANFENVLPMATDGSGNIYNGIGYIESGEYVNGIGGISQSKYYGCTGYIPVKTGDTVYVQGIDIGAGDGSAVFVGYDSSYTKKFSLTTNNEQFQGGNNYYFKYTALDNGFKIVVAPNGDPVDTAYLRFGFLTSWIKDTPIVAINEEITYSQVGVLADSIKVKGENVIGLPSGGGSVEEVFYVPFSFGATGFVLDGVTHADILAAYNDGKRIIGKAYVPQAAGLGAWGEFNIPMVCLQDNSTFTLAFISSVTSVEVYIASDDSVSLDVKVLQNIDSRVTSINSSSTHSSYPTAKAVYDARSDLSQNDTTAADYVKGRTHWFEYEEATLFDGSITTIQNKYAKVGALGLVEGKTYTVLWNGVEYTSTAVHVPFGSDMTAIAIGNLAIAGATPNTGEPFLIGDIDSGTVGFLSPVNGTFSVKVTGEIKKYNTLDVKYLPLGSQTCVLTLPGGSLGENPFMFGSYELSSISYDLFADILWNGGDLLVDFSNCFPGYPASLRIKASSWGYISDSGFAVWFITNFAFDNDELQSGGFDAIYLHFPNGSWQPPT